MIKTETNPTIFQFYAVVVNKKLFLISYRERKGNVNCPWISSTANLCSIFNPQPIKRVR